MSILTPHQKSALDFTDHLSLTANAGSGKTFVLARRYLNAALSPGISVSNIAAITFTDKAAGELYNKIVKLVTEQISLAESSELKLKLERIRRQLVSANISTIHSFCINILREYPVEAGLDARFVPIDEQLSDELIELSIEEVVKALLAEDSISGNVKYLIRLLGSKSRLESELFNLIKQRKNLLFIKDTIYRNTEDAITSYFKEQFDKYYFEIWDGYKTELLRCITSINETVLSKNPENGLAHEISGLLKDSDRLNSSEQILKFISEISKTMLTTGGTVKVRGYLSSDLKGGLEDELSIVESSLNDLSRIEYSADSALMLKELSKFGKILLDVFEIAMERYQIKKNQEGFLDYEDILLFTKEILKNESVQISLGEKYRFILVDEYQDTNEIQYEIFLPILGYLKLGNLFIVGDEKQSIYMFRDAELEIFTRTKIDISSQSGSGSLLELPDSFRMASGICLFTNKLFEILFARPNELYNEVKNTNIVCARPEDPIGEVEFIISDLSNDSSVSEAELVARRIIELNAAGTLFRGIAVLVRKRRSFSELEKEFIKFGIPFSIIGGRGFYQRQTISDIYNYLSFLSNSGNGVALTGVLRSPFFDISDSKLFEISLTTGNTFWEKFLNHSAVDKSLISIKDVLSENLRLASSLELTVLLRKILTDTEYLAVIASRVDGGQELANIEKLINISRSFSSKGFRNLYDFIDYLNDAITGIEDESQAAVTTDTDSVQLMTLHQAKGLEFPVVILFNTHESSPKTQIKSKQISISKKFGILTKLPLNENYLSEYVTTPLNGLYNFIEEKKRIAELKRLLYVGITRAMNHLIISGEVSPKQKLRNDSFLYLITSGLNIDFTGKKNQLSGDLDCLVLNDDKYTNKKVKINLELSVKNSVNLVNSIKPAAANYSKPLEINISSIEPPIEKDIISATKVAVYNQCPAKYLLTYEYGFGKINNLDHENTLSLHELENKALDSEEYGEDEIVLNKIKGNVKGVLIHSLLEREIKPDDIEKEIAKFLKKNGIADNQVTDNKNHIIHEYLSFTSSENYKNLSIHKNYKNEFQVYIKDDDVFLFGIMDKIIITVDEIIIVDYKTDDIDESEIEHRAENYSIQLKFYLYIVQKLFRNYNSFRLILMFIKYPEKPVVKSYNKNDFFLVKREISNIIKGIIQKDFHKNKEHCRICVYSDKNQNCKLK